MSPHVRITCSRCFSVEVSENAPPSLPSLDFGKVKKTLQGGSTLDQIILLQALRWVSGIIYTHTCIFVDIMCIYVLHVRVQRLTRSLPGMQREAILSSYISSDLLGCVGEEGSQHVEALLTLMKSPDPTVREQLTRLFNTFSSLSHGRSYLSESPPMTKALLDMLYSERRKDTATRRNALGAIQKLSLSYVWETQP